MICIIGLFFLGVREAINVDVFSLVLLGRT